MFPPCGFRFEALDGTITVCDQTGPHRCTPRGDHVVAFFAEVLVHTKGRWAKRPFVLEPWQEHEIIRPLFETVRLDEQAGYVRQYTVAWIEVGRKNGKSEMGAAVALYLLEGDGEEGAEVYGAAKDRGQARKVWDVADRMTILSPVLRRRLKVDRRSNRLSNGATGSYYETITRDALGELGHNPHGVIFDETLAQPDGALWDAMRTAMGARSQPLMFSMTTAGDDPTGFCGVMHDEMLRVAEDPSRAPHVFVYIRNTPRNVDIWDEANWRHANPALGTFLSVEALRQEAKEARQSQRAEKAFRQFRLNQWQSAKTRWIGLDEWDACVTELAASADWLLPKMVGPCFGGLDLSAKLDLSALAWWADGHMMWRHWAPEGALPALDKATGGMASVWAKQGWLTVTDGDVIDYTAIEDAVAADTERLTVAGLAYDEWSGEPLRQRIEERTGITMHPVRMSYQRMTGPMKELERLVAARTLNHGGNPVARWCLENVDVRTNRQNPEEIRPDRPDRQTSGKRIDGAIAAILAVEASMVTGAEEEADLEFIAL